MRLRIPHAVRHGFSAPVWGVATVATLGCALPLVLGLVSGHNGFLWAALGAFQAALANPLHRYGMLRMLLIGTLGALAAALGYTAASHPLYSLLLFAAMGLLLARLQRYGNEAGKLGLGLAVCLCLGQGSHGQSDLNNAGAVAMLFLLGALWTTLLAFILRGLHALRTWPYMPRLLAVLRVMRRQARSVPRQPWLLHALACILALGLAGLFIDLLELAHGYWLSLTVVIMLQLNLVRGLRPLLYMALAVLLVSALMTAIGHSLQRPLLLSALLLPVIFFNRAFQASHYLLFAIQTTLGCLLLREGLATDWLQPQGRLLNVVLGIVLVLMMASLVQALQRVLARGRSA
ncbi:FUSC family protein [Pseudomonas sp. RL]|uniref:FUSC family protein n=1 Tax=Pseudomonas sp. RL TaxID=1452718 RepID=UPI0006894BB6|nr:FUSC family protein [Pseudomonas sp. RL]